MWDRQPDRQTSGKYSRTIIYLQACLIVSYAMQPVFYISGYRGL